MAAAWFSVIQLIIVAVVQCGSFQKNRKQVFLVAFEIVYHHYIFCVYAFTDNMLILQFPAPLALWYTLWANVFLYFTAFYFL